MATKYSTKEADLSLDAPVIQALWVRNLEGHDTASAQAKMRLGYLDNPAGLGVVLLLQVDDLPQGRAALGLHPRRVHLGPRSLATIGMADFVVDAAHRSLGPAMQLLRQGAQIGVERFDLVYALPNAKAAPLFARTALKRLGSLQRYARPLTSRKLLATRLPSWLASQVAFLLDPILHLVESRRALRARARLVCSLADWDDPAFDELWSQRPTSTLLSERTARMLKWRFGAPERGDWRVCVARSTDGAARGYVVWRANEGLVEIGDFFSNDPPGWTLALMLAFTRLVRRSDAHSITVEFFGSTQVARQLQDAGLRIRPQKAPIFAGANASLAFESPEAWYLTGFDNDAD